MIDEDGLGYADVGEEIDWGTAEEEQQEAPGSASKGTGKKGAQLPAAAPLLPRYFYAHSCGALPALYSCSFSAACSSSHLVLLLRASPPAAGAAAGAKRKAAAEAVPGARVRMQKMFQTAQAKPKPRVAVDDASADALLDDILGGLDGGSDGGAGGGGSKCVGREGGQGSVGRVSGGVAAPAWQKRQHQHGATLLLAP